MAIQRVGFTLPEMRPWDLALLKRYPPVFHTVSSTCTLCALGPCDLAKDRAGACGQNLEVFLARESLLIAVTGAAAHAAHARDLISRLMADKGAEMALDLGQWVQIRMPITQVVAGVNPRRLGDLAAVLDYIDSQIVRLLGAAHYGGESSPLDLQAKAFHAGTMDILAMEVADVAQIAGHDFPRGDAETPMVRLGFADLPPDKPLILCIGHHADVGHRLMHRVHDGNLAEAVEVAGLCCTAHDMARGSAADHDRHRHHGDHGPRIIGNMRDQLRFVRAGRADVVVIDQQCIRSDLLSETLKTGACFIATSDQTIAGLPDETHRAPTELAAELAGRPLKGAYIADPDKAAELALALARLRGRVARPTRGIPALPGSGVCRDIAPFWDEAARCTECGLCTTHCPLGLPVAEKLCDVGRAPVGDAAAARAALGKLWELCIGCGRCDAACPGALPVMSILEVAANPDPDDGWVRTGRGPIDDYEIKSAGPAIVLGEIPGVVALLTCPEYPDGRDAVAWIAGILAGRGYIVLAAGCAALDLGRGQNGVYLKFPSTFDTGSVVNTGSCVSASHAVGALIKVASIFQQRKLDGNYREIADFMLNRVGAVGLLYGAVTPKSFAAACGANRLGVPVVFGPHGRNFRRTLEGDPAAGGVFDARTGETVPGLAPAHLAVTAGSREEALVAAVRLCMRPNDTTEGRRTKLRHYLELSETYRRNRPLDLAACVRVADDLPEEYRTELLPRLEQSGWKPSFIPDPTLLQRLVRS